ncbi:MAG: GNAT family N-acetyltransferase [Promethearchaeota archaeon]
MHQILRDVSKTVIGTALEANLIAQVKYFGKSPLVKLFDDRDNMVRILTGLPISTLNLVAGARLSSNEVKTEVELALKPFKEQNVPMIWWVGPTTEPKDLGVYLETQGLVKSSDMPGMFFDLEELDGKLKLPPYFSFRPVVNDTLLQIWAKTETKGFGANDSFTKHIYEFEKSLGTDPNSPWLRYIGFIDKEPVAVSILFQAAGVAAIFNVATVPKYRRRGIGTLMTKIPLFKARSLGYKWGVLKASPMGTLLYQQMHFKEVCKIGLYYPNQKFYHTS